MLNISYRGFLSPLLLLSLLVCLFVACAVNPATKRREFMIVSEEQEFQIGKSVDKKVREEMGVYLELPELRSLVKGMGENIGRNSDRPNLIYRIEIVNLPDFNAFAVPGGFVYVNRGLLERMNSADDLASVLGHEIAHVAARHSAAQISKAQLMNIGLLGVSVASEGAVQDYGGLINLGGALAFNKFSRDDEREADYFGTKYVAKAGYNPKASIDVMKQIERIQNKEPTTLETWFMTHPPTSERLVNLNREIDELRQEQPEVLMRPIQRNPYVAALDGLVVGEWNGNELTTGNRYYNKEFLVSIEIPEEWYARINSRQFTAIFIHPKREFTAFFDVEPLRISKSTEEYFDDFENRVKQLGLRRIHDLAVDRISRHGALSGIYEGRDTRGNFIKAEGIAFVGGTNGYSLIAASKEDDFEEFKPIVESMVESLRFLSEKEAAELEPPRLRVHKVRKGETWAAIAQEYFGSSQGMEKLAHYNGLETSQNLSPGILLKIPPTLRFR